MLRPELPNYHRGGLGSFTELGHGNDDGTVIRQPALYRNQPPANGTTDPLQVAGHTLIGIVGETWPKLLGSDGVTLQGQLMTRWRRP